MSVKERAQRYRIEQYLPATVRHNQTAAGLDAGSASYSFSVGPSHKVQPSTDFHRINAPHGQPALPSDMSREQYDALTQGLQNHLEVAEQEIDELEIELMELAKARDKTPAAILFFAMMHDPSYVPNLQQLVLQFQHLKQFMNYTAHMDYLPLRKRLQVCLVLMPSVEKLVDKYGIMYQSWSHVRLNWFAERKLRGGSADAMAYCPLCFNNLEDTKDEFQQPSSPKRNQGAKKAREERQQVKNQRKKLIQNVNSISLPALNASAQINVSGNATPLTGRNSVNSASGSYGVSMSSGYASGSGGRRGV